MQSQLLEEKARELSDCHDQLEVAREAEEEYERHFDDEQAKNKRRIHTLEVMGDGPPAPWIFPPAFRRRGTLSSLSCRLMPR